MTIYFKGIRIIWGIDLREQEISLQLKGTLPKIFLETMELRKSEIF